MIQGFFTTMQSDWSLLSDKMNNNVSGDKETQRRVDLAAMRFFATVGMGIGIVFALKALPLFAASTIAGLLALGLGVAVYAIGHDVFVIAKNESDQSANLLGRAAAVVGSKLGDVVDLVKGKKNINDAPRHHCTDGTLLRPFWDKLFAIRTNEG